MCQKSIYSLFSKNFASLSHFFVSFLATFLRKSCFIFLVFFTFCPIFILKSFWCQHKRCHLCFLIDFLLGGGGRRSFALCFCTLFVLIKRATGAYRSCRSLQKKRQERCALVTLYKITGAIHSGCSLQKEQKSEEQKSDLLFLRVALKRKHQTRSFHPAFPLCMPKTKERILSKNK